VLQHVALETREQDVEAALAFWALLGFEPVAVPPGLAGRTHWVQRGGTQIHLLLTADPVVPRGGHAAVVADDYDATLDALRAAGHPVDPHPEHWGVPRAFVTSPSGHAVEVMSAPPPG
jgi:catechol 2,3-dioxygenase-like lactoylglutathione lyase family enzyme